MTGIVPDVGSLSYRQNKNRSVLIISMDSDGMQEITPAPDRVRIILPPASCLRRRQAGNRYNIKIERIKSRKNMLI